MAAHLPFVTKRNDSDVELVIFYPAYQYCIEQSGKNQRVANVLKAISALGGTVILFLLGFWSADPQLQARNQAIMIAAKSLALLVSLSSALNYLFDYQRKSNKYESARRVILLLEAEYNNAVRDKTGDTAYLGRMETWAGKNFNKIEERLDNDKVYDVGLGFEAEPLPT